MSGTTMTAGEWVQIRSKEEILRTLDGNGRLDEMPFMPEMLQFAGQRFRVSKRAHKTCDPVNGLESRRLDSAVHLENLRCDGSAHAGCQAGCLLFWKDAWLKPADAPADDAPIGGGSGCTERDLAAATIAEGHAATDADPTYVCQATQVAAATTPLPWWDLRQYVEDYRSGNATIGQIVSAAVFWIYHRISEDGFGVGSALRWSYDKVQRLLGGSPYPLRPGKVRKGERTPSLRLDVQEGELVKIKTYDEILETLDETWRNRGLYFDPEMVPYTNGTYRVLKRVNRIIHEKTGKMLRFKNEALILDEVVCQARYAKCRRLCPRGYYLYWREIWLDRAEPCAARSADAAASPGSCAV